MPFLIVVYVFIYAFIYIHVSFFSSLLINSEIKRDWVRNRTGHRTM